MKRTLLTLALSAALAPGLSAWGHKGHKIAAGLALKALPPEVAAFYKGREEFVEEHSPDPDRWRKDDRKEGPRHYIDTEPYGGPAGVPFGIAAAEAKIGTPAFLKDGQVVWVVQDRYKELVEAFRSKDAERIAMATAILSHYVSDAQVPLHTTENHDGQLTDQRGVHSRWESGLVERYLDPAQVHPRRAEVLKDPLRAPWAWIKEANAQVKDVLADDADANATSPTTRRGTRRTGGYWALYWEAQGPTVETQMARSAERIADLVLTAWTEAGKPKA